ncbi:M23 family metallopeptidase [Anoxybacillus sp. LAT_35]|uniref:peptidoglycan DD-metalloendopeptidase family protein n=1 Tax=Anoxybacillus TaxID=150247 RepID=UPI001EDC6182|nr:M23 family metallopeptidase [Anoxybacillus sp. LAT_26]MCG3085984.1 M23 family metallopeptidase [Anoxybacillus sp. LAT27]MCG5024719.1 M23 family metallopeptidase [Anoxybacillus flavithermus]MCG6172780.1 M23 family metallopeptidase [Anoxybacillus sp. LAT_11]MCG6174027.1 M23 family metallopeptidase [Anoxybacillus sp. LAT_31]MCG6176561.1 M23 family metallopeptidase [Anoxybacillus sp. LAT_35]MCG6180516.1 M23 family metallopeptidase [Anoxybacillus sp. LAT_33]MCG6198122.1 M23 family metallopepti
MSDRIEHIRKRMAKRKKQRERYVQTMLTNWSEDEKYGNPTVVTYDGDREPPLFRKDIFLLKSFLAAMLFFSVAILFQYDSPKMEEARTFVKQVMEEDFQFATVAQWYENTFGKPLAFFQTKKQQETTAATYAFPASARVVETFEHNGQGVVIETNQAIKAVEEGIVVFAGVKEPYGKTVIIQHADGSETWYGKLSAISVKLYDFIEAGKEVGKAEANNQKSVFYFAVKKGDRFIDPVQVISFE